MTPKHVCGRRARHYGCTSAQQDGSWARSDVATGTECHAGIEALTEGTTSRDRCAPSLVAHPSAHRRISGQTLPFEMARSACRHARSAQLVVEAARYVTKLAACNDVEESESRVSLMPMLGDLLAGRANLPGVSRVARAFDPSLAAQVGPPRRGRGYTRRLCSRRAVGLQSLCGGGRLGHADFEPKGHRRSRNHLLAGNGSLAFDCSWVQRARPNWPLCAER